MAPSRRNHPARNPYSKTKTSLLKSPSIQETSGTEDESKPSAAETPSKPPPEDTKLLCSPDCSVESLIPEMLTASKRPPPNTKELHSRHDHGVMKKCKTTPPKSEISPMLAEEPHVSQQDPLCLQPQGEHSSQRNIMMPVVLHPKDSSAALLVPAIEPNHCGVSQEMVPQVFNLNQDAHLQTNTEKIPEGLIPQVNAQNQISYHPHVTASPVRTCLVDASNPIHEPSPHRQPQVRMVHSSVAPDPSPVGHGLIDASSPVQRQRQNNAVERVFVGLARAGLFFAFVTHKNRPDEPALLYDVKSKFNENPLVIDDIPLHVVCVKKDDTNPDIPKTYPRYHANGDVKPGETTTMEIFIYPCKNVPANPAPALAAWGVNIAKAFTFISRYGRTYRFVRDITDYKNLLHIGDIVTTRSVFEIAKKIKKTDNIDVLVRDNELMESLFGPHRAKKVLEHYHAGTLNHTEQLFHHTQQNNGRLLGLNAIP